MKKALAVLLSFVLLMCSVSGTFTALAEGDSTSVDHFENTENWHLEKISSNTVALGTGVPSNWSSWATVKKDSENFCGEGSTSSIAVSCNYHAGWLDLPDLEKDTEYTLTFNYTAPNGLEGTTLKSAFQSIGIYSPTVGGNSVNVAVSGSAFNPVDGFFHRKSTTSFSSYASADGLAANAVETEQSAHVANQDDAWHTMTLNFNSNEYNDFIMLFTFGSVTPVCMDNFVLTVKEKPDYFETESNWRVDAYTSDPANATIGYKDAFANAKVTRSNAFAEDGRDTVMKVFTPSQFTSIMLPDLEANYDYTLSFSYMAENITAGAVFSRLGIYAPDVEGANFQYQNKGFIFDILVGGGYRTDDFVNYLGVSQNTAATEANKWYDISITFNAGDLGRLALVFISAVDTEHVAYVDNFVLTKGKYNISKAASDVVEFKGNSIRKQSSEYAQGLRFKFFMDKNYKNLYANKGYTAVEVGILALRKEYLEGKELLRDAEYSYNDKTYTPRCSLVSEVNYQYDENDPDNIYFTAALINIGKSKTTDEINYDTYANDFVVRAFTVYEDENGNKTTVYSDQQAANVFEVVYAILQAPQSDTDKDAAESAIENCKDKYDAWVGENHPAA